MNINIFVRFTIFKLRAATGNTIQVFFTITNRRRFSSNKCLHGSMKLRIIFKKAHLLEMYVIFIRNTSYNVSTCLPSLAIISIYIPIFDDFIAMFTMFSI